MRPQPTDFSLRWVTVSENPHRLPRHVVPSRYDLRLEPDLDAATFTGEETITVEVVTPTAEVLMLFGIMLTRARIGRDVDATNDHWWSGVITALLLVGVMAYALVDYYGGDKLPADRQINAVAGSNTATVSDSIFSQYLIPFEVVSVLLLAALVGAIVIARKDR
jgi:NADH:ubiquinone oxidoreductase subunit 6 (subunit J)